MTSQHLTPKFIRPIIQPLVATLLLCKESATKEHNCVDKIKRQVLVESVYLNAEGERIIEPKYDWFIEHAEPYYTKLKYNGYEPAKDKLLVTEAKLRAAEVALLKVADEIFDTRFSTIYDKNRAEALELLIGLGHK